MNIIKRLTAAEIQLSFSTCGHCCRMKRLSRARVFHGFRHARYLAAKQIASPGFPGQPFSRHFFAPATFQAPAAVCRALPHSPGVPSQHSPARLHSHKARLRRNDGRLLLTFVGIYHSEQMLARDATVLQVRYCHASIIEWNGDQDRNRFAGPEKCGNIFANGSNPDSHLQKVLSNNQ
jgi:hypothetical protein